MAKFVIIFKTNQSIKTSMKKNLYVSLMLAASLSTAASALAAAPGNRVFYGFNLGSAEWKDEVKAYDCGFVSYPFDLSEKGTVLHSYLDQTSVGAYAGGGKDGIVYVVLYEYTTSTEQPKATDLMAYNTYNGLLESVGQWNPEQTAFKPQDMTYDAVSGNMYAIGYENGVSALYTVDLSTAKFDKVVNLQIGGGTLAADAKGTIYTISSDGYLYSLNTDANGAFNGRLTEVYNTGLSGMPYVQSMEFDHTTGKLYWASCTYGHELGAENVYMQEIDLSDPNNITMTEIGRLGIQSRFVGLYIPSAESLGAPAAPTNIKSEAGADGALTATLSWKNPSEAFGGGEIGNLYNVLIKRDGEKVALLNNPVAGEVMTWTDENVPEAGYYRYDIQVINGKGTGANGYAYQYVGHDAPAAVSGIKATVAESMKEITLTWDAPTTGARLGSFNPADTRYSVVRNDGIVVAENLTECKVTDTRFVRLMGYSYDIISSNDYGQSKAASQAYILGPAFELPLEQTFENRGEIDNRWTVVDGNADTYSWMFYTNLGQAIFGDYEVCAEYIVSPTLGNTENANEWLISPPLALEANKEYELTVSGRCYTVRDKEYVDEILDVYCGKMNTVEAMTQKLGTLNVAVNDRDASTGTMAFVRQSVALPVQTEDATLCVGLNLVTELPTSGYLQLNGIYVGEKGEFNGIEGVTAASDVAVSLTGRTLVITGHFNTAKLYNLQGACVMDASAMTDLSMLSSGVYVLSVDGRSFKIAL